MTPNSPRARLAYTGKQFPQVLRDTAYVVAHTLGADRGAVFVAEPEDLPQLFSASNHPAEALVPWVGKELHKLRKEVDKGTVPPHDLVVAVNLLEAKLPAIAVWVEQTKPDLTKLSMADALQAVVTFEPEEASVPQGRVIYRFADGWSVQELLTPEQVYPEGVAVQNCLRGDQQGPRYCERIDAGEIRIFSLRTPRGEPRVSMMFETDEDSKHGGCFEEISAKQNTSLNATRQGAGDEALWAGIQKYKPRVQEFIRESFSSEPVGMIIAGADPETLDLSGADLNGANLSGADLSGMNLIGANLRYASLCSAILIGMDLRGMDLRGANLDHANLHGADLRGAIMTRANLISVNLSGADLSDVDFSDATLRGADLTDTNLTRADLSGAYMAHANLTGANLTGANLRSANLISANLISANLPGANLSGVDFSNATLRDADMTVTNLTRANLTGANLTGTKHDESTVWPQGFVV
jgi:uncharacterized protein YjbI with pentapeptide repeats